MPVVSASEIPSTPAPRNASTKRSTASSLTLPSKGQPKVVDRLIVIRMPASCATRTMVGSSASDCSCVRLMLARLWVSDADITPFTSSGLRGAAAAFCTPRRFGTSATYTTPGTRRCPQDLVRVRSAGMAFGLTKEVTSILA